MPFLDRAKKIQADLQRLTDEISANLVAAEDVLTTLEDREARRAARSGGPIDDKYPAVRGRTNA